mmetsp:Transcript_22404/g.68992  ORF Transcript_22404/g.68992 Transcript_22404/m.68992 type:complete len:320 (+) Transcript_22404:40-999(+)
MASSPGPDAGGCCRVLYCDEAVVAVSKAGNVLSVPGNEPGSDTSEKRTRAASYWRVAATKVLGVELEALPRRQKAPFERYLERRKVACPPDAYERIRRLAFALERDDYGQRDAKTAFGATRDLLGDPELRIVHRLDYETSGVLVFARSSAAAAALCRAFRRESFIAKTYVAIVRGKLTGAGEWTWPIAKDPSSAVPRYRRDDAAGKHAITRFRVVEEEVDESRRRVDESNPTRRGISTTRLCLTPVTGRSHQLRVHCAEAGHPILGDPLYDPLDEDVPGEGVVATRRSRLCLHAARLQVAHPSPDQDGRLLTFVSDPPF